MGNACKCVCRQTDDDALDALLGFEEDGERPRGPPPPYEPQAPIYSYPQMTEEQRLHLVRRLTLIQCLPSGRYEVKKSSEKKGEMRECPICMMDYKVGDAIRLLPCMHYYHLHCIDDWLVRSFTCPTCMERVDIGMRNTVHTSRTRGSWRRRRVSSSSSSNSITSSSGHSNNLMSGQSRQSEQMGMDLGPSPCAVSPSSPVRVVSPTSPVRVVSPTSPVRVVSPTSPSVFVNGPPSPPLITVHSDPSFHGNSNPLRQRNFSS